MDRPIMKFKDKKNQLFNVFKDEWYNLCSDESTKISWTDLIKTKHLGIIVDVYRIYQNDYIIIDKNKWILNKIKYGI